jgi:hypothetical protein
MDGRLGRLNCHYRVIAGSAAGVSAAARLDRVAREGLAPACARRLESIMGADPSVYMVRRVNVPLVLNTKAEWDDQVLARQWAAYVTGAAVREVAKGVDTVNVMRFEDQADLVARFIPDLLRGEAWNRWFYNCFASLRALPPADAALAVLLENRERIPAVLARLRRLGALDLLLGALDRAALRQIWTYGIDSSAGATDAEIRPLFAAVVRLAETAGGAGDRECGSSAERWLQEYVTSGPSPPDWRDRSGLALAVLSALEFLWKRGYLRASPSSIASAWRTHGKLAPGEFDWLDADLLQAALERFASRDEVAGPSPKGGRTEPVLRPDAGTPRRRRLIADLAEAVAAELPALSVGWLEAPATALRLYSRLVSQRVDWEGDPLAAQAIQGVLAAAAWMADTGTWIDTALAALAEHTGPAGALARACLSAFQEGRWDELRLVAAIEPTLVAIEHGGSAIPDVAADSEDLIRMCLLLQLRLPGSSRSGRAAQQLLAKLARRWEAERALAPRRSAWERPLLEALERPSRHAEAARQFLRTFGETGMDLAAAAASGVAAAQAGRLAESRTGVESECAGVFLLIRAMLDARLATVAAAAGYPLAPTILALGLCWGGERAVYQGTLDAGIGLLAGQDAGVTLEELRSIWRQVDRLSHARFQSRMLAVLVGRQVAGGAVLELHRIQMEKGHYAVVCGERDASVWPLVRIVESESGEPAAIVEIREAWREATGEDPILVEAGDESVAALRAALDAVRGDGVDEPLANWTLALTSISLLRVWAAWLRQFSTSSAPYLLNNFIRRPGRIEKVQQNLLVELAPRPLDIVIEMAGYVARLHAHTEPWECIVQFTIQES